MWGTLMSATFPSRLSSAVDSVFERFWRTRPSPALAYGVVTTDGLVHSRGLGELRPGGGPPTSTSLFRVASLTKSFTAAAALTLRDAGRLELDAPVHAYVPFLRGSWDPDGPWEPPTVRQLLTMGSGLPDDDPWADRLLGMTRDRFDRLLADGLRPAYRPGTTYAYSNLGYAILGRIVAQVSAETYGAFVTQGLLAPLRLARTGFTPAVASEAERAVGYEYEPATRGLTRRRSTGWQPAVRLRSRAFSPAGGLWSCVDDLATWVKGFVDSHGKRESGQNEHPLGESSRRELQRVARLVPRAAPHVVGREGTSVFWCPSCASDTGSALSATARSGLEDEAESVGYGMGLMTKTIPTMGTVVGHRGGLPGYGAAMWWHPASQLGVVALCNSTYAPVDQAAEQALLGAVRVLPSGKSSLWGECAQALHAIVRLLTVWDESVAGSVFADNFDRTTLGRVRSCFASVRACLGDPLCEGIRMTDVASPAHAKWRIPMDRGWVEVTVKMSPERRPMVQSLRLEPSESCGSQALRTQGRHVRVRS